MTLLFKDVIFTLQPLIFPGCIQIEHENIWKNNMEEIDRLIISGWIDLNSPWWWRTFCSCQGSRESSIILSNSSDSYNIKVETTIQDFKGQGKNPSIYVAGPELTTSQALSWWNTDPPKDFELWYQRFSKAPCPTMKTSSPVLPVVGCRLPKKGHWIIGLVEEKGSIWHWWRKPLLFWVMMGKPGDHGAG